MAGVEKTGMVGWPVSVLPDDTGTELEPIVDSKFVAEPAPLSVLLDIVLDGCCFSFSASFSNSPSVAGEP